MKKLFATTFLIITSLFSYECPGEPRYNPCAFDADLFSKCRKVWFANAELLYWTVDSSTLDYAFDFNKDVPATGTNQAYGRFLNSDYGWSPNFRISFGFFNAPHYWQAYAQYTWLRIDGHKSKEKSSTSQQPIVGTFSQTDLAGQLKEARTNIKLYEDLLDFLTSRTYITNPHFRLRVIGGITAGRIKQNWGIKYITINNEIEKIKNNWRFKGIGLRLGLDLDWFWGHDLYLTGKFSAAPFFGKYKYISQIIVKDVNMQDWEYDQYRGSLNIQTYFGPSYQKNLKSNRVEIFLGYEINSWFNIQESIKLDDRDSNNLYQTPKVPKINSTLLLLNGLTFRTTLDF